jgi:glucokinase
MHVTSVVAGIDLGGTATRVAIWGDRQVIAEDTVTTRLLGDGPPSQRVAALWSVVAGASPPGCRVAGIGIGASGPIHPITGIIKNPATLPWFSGFDLVSELSDLAAVPVVIDNDAVTAALGEYECGAGQGVDRLLLVTLGTGIGVAMLERGRPFRWADGQNPEAGHIPVSGDTERCYCGLEGCWESTASRDALERAAGPLLQATALTTDVIPRAAERAQSGDQKVIDVFVEYGRKVGRGIVALHSIYGPNATVIGGSVSRYLDLLRTGLDESLTRSEGFAQSITVHRAQLGHFGGAIGAALLATHRIETD